MNKIFSIFILLCFVVYTVKSSVPIYIWSGACTSECDLDDINNYSGVTGFPSPKDWSLAHIEVNSATVASTQSNYQIGILRAPTCVVKKRDVQETEALPVIDLKFSNNSVLIQSACFYTGYNSLITFTNSNVTTFYSEVSSPNYWETYPETRLTFDRCNVNFNKTDIYSNGQTDILIINSNWRKDDISYVNPDEFQASGFILENQDRLKFQDSTVHTPCPISFIPGTKWIFQGVNTVTTSSNDNCPAPGSVVNGGLTVLGSSIVNATGQTWICGGSAKHTMEGNTRVLLHKYWVQNYGDLQVDVRGWLDLNYFVMENLQRPNVTVVTIYAGANLTVQNNMLMTIMNAKRGSSQNIAGYLVNKGNIWVGGQVYIQDGFHLNATTGSSTVFNGDVQTKKGLYFEGGNVTFSGSIWTETGDALFTVNNGGVITFANAQINLPYGNNTFNYGSGLVIGASTLAEASFVINEGAYLATTGAASMVTQNLYVLFGGEIRTGLFQLGIGNLVISSGAIVVIQAAETSCGSVSVVSLVIEDGVDFEFQFVGQNLPANGTIYIIAQASELYVSIPSGPIQAVTGVMLHFYLEDSKIKVWVENTIPPPQAPTPSGPPTDTPPQAPTDTPPQAPDASPQAPTGSPNGASRTIVDVVLFIMSILVLLNF